MVYSPEPLVYHDNWMPTAESNRQLYGYVFSASVVFSRFFLRGSLTAARVSLFFLREFLMDLLRAVRRTDGSGIKHQCKLLGAWFEGFFLGVMSVLRRPPRLRQKSMQSREPSEA